MTTVPRQDKSPPPPLSHMPDPSGRYGKFGGQYVPETLMAALAELEDLYLSVRENVQFWDELRELNHTFIGRPTPL